MEQAFADYLTALNIPVSRRYFRKRIASHPDYPSLLSISDTFEQLGIPHGVAHLEKEQLGTLTFPYVLYLEKGSGRQSCQIQPLSLYPSAVAAAAGGLYSV